MINRFSQFLVEEESVVYFTFGRMNPPTIGHGKLLDTLASKARRAPYRIFLSHHVCRHSANGTERLFVFYGKDQRGQSYSL